MKPGMVHADQIGEHYRARNMAAVVFTVDARSATNRDANSVEEIADLAAANNDVLIPFGSVDPWRHDAAARIGALIEERGVKGFKFHPSLQAFAPNDRAFYPLYEIIDGAGLPVLFHTGQTGIGAGLRGGHGIKLRYSEPMLLDDIAADFPTLTIVMAHPWIRGQQQAVTVFGE
jgi:predicted TIM-barrel fold metal-dependent hydrolase